VSSVAMMQESRLTNFQQRQLDKAVKGAITVLLNDTIHCVRKKTAPLNMSK